MNGFTPEGIQRSVLRIVRRPGNSIARMESTANEYPETLDEFMHSSPSWPQFRDLFMETLDVLRREALIELIQNDQDEPEYRLTARGAALLGER
jgi:hypothetical protein